MRRSLITAIVALLVLVGLGSVAVATGSGSTVTQARLERSLTTSFAHVYSQQAKLLGHRGVTPASLHAKAMCDDGAGNVGPSANWNCLMSWHDPNVPMPSTGYGKFELNVHSNDCYTAGSPSSLVGYQTITDARGRTVNNPAYEFDACFDPNAPDKPTGVSFPSALTITTTSIAPDPQGKDTLAMLCATGADGCAGSIAVTAPDGTKLGSVPFDLEENETAKLTLPTLPAGTKSVDLAVTYRRGVGSTGTTLPVTGG
jgi:hypothetical protein